MKKSQSYSIIPAILLLTLSLLPLAKTIYASEAVYTVEGIFKAAFPSLPHFIGIAGTGDYKYRSFISLDEVNLVNYRAAYGINALNPKNNNISESINSFIRGEASGLGDKARITYIKPKLIGSDHGALYSIELEYNGLPARIFGVVIYSGGRFIAWGIQDIPSLSKKDGETVFNSYSKYFMATNQADKAIIQRTPSTILNKHASTCSDMSQVEKTGCYIEILRILEEKLNNAYITAFIAIDDYIPPHRKDEWSNDFYKVRDIWFTYRDMECDLVRRKWDTGSGAGIGMVKCQMQMTKERIEEIKALDEHDWKD